MNRKRVRSFASIAFLFTLLSVGQSLAVGETKRVVTIQCDGLPFEVVDRFVKERDPRSGNSRLPWIDYIFYKHGTRLANFYVRGMSLSAPSWSLIDTGQHLQIKGNVEFDRYTMQTYDYLNFVPFYVKATVGMRVDMQGVEVLDDIGIPLLTDAFPHDEKHESLSLFVRGARFMMFQRALENKASAGPRDLFDEWTTGFDIASSVPEQFVRDMIEGINNPRVRYAQVVLTDFDHRAHHNNDREAQLLVLRELDSVIGRVWSAIQESPLAEETALIVVSDHGINSEEHVYSQGFNLVKLLGSAEGGGHHVVTKRRLMADYSIKGVNPFSQVITTPARDSYYLKGETEKYPTALLDFDGNERTQLHFRDSDLNLLQILLQQTKRPDLGPELRKAVTEQIFATLDRRRQDWKFDLDRLTEELGAIRRSIVTQRERCAAQPKKFTPEQTAAGLDDDAKRICAQVDRWSGQERNYGEYARIMTNLLRLQPGDIGTKLKIEELIPAHAMGQRNTSFQLRNYLAGIGPAGLVLTPDGRLDMQKSFVYVDYFSLLHSQSVKNNVQPDVSSHPIDMIAIRVPSAAIQSLVNEQGLTEDAVWVYGGEDRQALILARENRGVLSFRYVPIKNFNEDKNGQMHFELADWAPGFPLHIFEDDQLMIDGANRSRWLSQWHTDVEWLQAVHKTRYSNGVIGLYEELARHRIARLADDDSSTGDEKLMRRFVRRQRENIETDILLVANDHWNFDVRGFNPGGNHGSFFRISTHSTFLLAGGRKTGIPQAFVVEEPYDSLSFVPTVLALTGNLRDDSNPIPVLWEKGFRRFPGRVVREVLGKPETQKIAVTGTTTP
ncbi:MAG TPA: alkaline phosphatase family protein [Pyrinomonadaceae bacterium]|nr:alkaline phosphatase family protein [Pyrinomonadaceae bacterium]